MDEEEENKLAVALKYQQDLDDAPRVVAKGQKKIAEQIIAMAKENDIPIHEDADLVEILSVLDLDSYIPIEAYLAVAEILSYIYKENSNKSGAK